MAELDPFDLRLAAAVRALADGADTRVDAIAVAVGSVGRRRRWPLSLAGLPMPVPATVLVLLGLLLALFASMPSGSPHLNAGPIVAPMMTPAPTGSIPSTDGVGDEYVSGTGTFWIVSSGTSAQVGEVTAVRGFQATSRDAMNDPRVSGTGTLLLSMDTRASVGTQWGTYRLVTADGRWEGAVTGAGWSSGNASDVAGYLAGFGAYNGFTYYIHVRSAGTTTEIEGIIYPGSPPGP
jgi:hypothetical protein